MTSNSNSSEIFLSIDEGHYNNSQSLILKECYDDNNQQVNKSLSNIKMSESQVNDNEQDLQSSLNEELERLSENKNQVSGQQIEQIHKAIRNITIFQQSLKQKMVVATDLIQIGNKKQQQLFQMVYKLKDNLQTPCHIKQHGLYEDQLKKNKQLLDESQKQLQNLVQTLKNQNLIKAIPKQIEASQESRLQKTAGKINLNNQNINDESIDKSIEKSFIKKHLNKNIHEHEIINQCQNYKKNPFMILFKKSVFENPFVLYQDQDLMINQEVRPKGLKIKLHSQDPNTILNIRGAKGKSLVLTWQQFTQAKRCFQDCTVEKSDGDSFTLSIPIPIHLLFQKRFKFTQISNLSKPKMKDLMNCYHLSISQYDSSIWRQLIQTPNVISFEMQQQKLFGIFTIKNDSSVYIVQIYELEQGLKLQIDVYYKSKQYLKQITQFFKYLICS